VTTDSVTSLHPMYIDYWSNGTDCLHPSSDNSATGSYVSVTYVFHSSFLWCIADIGQSAMQFSGSEQSIRRASVVFLCVYTITFEQLLTMDDFSRSYSACTTTMWHRTTVDVGPTPWPHGNWRHGFWYSPIAYMLNYFCYYYKIVNEVHMQTYRKKHLSK